MRLFIAATFDKRTKEGLRFIIEGLKSQAVAGNFTYYDNLHITLAFIGESERADDIKRIMDGVKADSAIMGLSGLGAFKSGSGDLLWMGAVGCPALVNVHMQLQAELRAEGFDIEDRSYKPHITLGRRVIFPANFDLPAFSEGAPQLRARFSGISLMESKQINGKLTYTEIYRKNFSTHK